MFKPVNTNQASSHAYLALTVLIILFGIFTKLEILIMEIYTQARKENITHNPI
jgi:hypothetical protein